MKGTGIECPISKKTVRLENINDIYCTRLVLLGNLLGHGLDAHPGLGNEALDLAGAGIEASTAGRQFHGNRHREVGHSEGIVVTAAGSSVQNVGGTANGILRSGRTLDGIRSSLGHLIVVAPAAGQSTAIRLAMV